METNQNPVQEQSVQYITPENTQAEQQPVPSPEQPTGQLAPKPEPQPEQPTEKLYNPAEAARIVQSLTEDYFNPEYILLFGKLVGGTHHSDAMAYDLLMVVRNARIQLDSGKTHPALQSAVQQARDHLYQPLHYAFELCRVE